jgi:hypothetical protein
MMTDEEWESRRLAAYEAMGRELATATWTDQTTTAVESPQGPAMGTPEWDAGRLAKSLIRQDEARETLRKQRGTQVSMVNVAAAEARERALQQAWEHAPATVTEDRPGKGMMLNGEPVLATLTDKGLVKEIRGAVSGWRVIGPGEFDAHDEAWRTLRCREENELLAREYGADACVAAGLFTAQEAAALDPGRSRHVVLPGGVEAL